MLKNPLSSPSPPVQEWQPPTSVVCRPRLTSAYVGIIHDINDLSFLTRLDLAWQV